MLNHKSKDGFNKTLNKIVDPYLTMLNSLPKVALGPLIIIIAGANTKSIIVMALLISTIITIINNTMIIPIIKIFLSLIFLYLRFFK